MEGLRVTYLTNDAGFFVNHRLPWALKVAELGGEVTLITGTSASKKIELAAIDKLKKYNISHTQCKFSQGLRNPIYEIYGLFQVIHALRRIKPDVLQCYY